MQQILIILGILFCHFIFDFICQTDKNALGKSKNWTDLLEHTASYSALWFMVLLPFCGINCIPQLLWLAPITFVVYTIQDYITSREVVKLYKAGRRHDMFVVIGLDQFLHYCQLLITFQLLIQ